MKKIPITLEKLICLMALFGFLQMPLTAQNCAKSVSYRILESRTFQIPDSTDLDSLSFSDILMGKPEHRIKDVEMCIDSLGFIRITTTYSPDTIQHWRIFPIHQSILDRSGMHVYNADNELIYEESIATLDTFPGITFPMSQDEIDNYGVLNDYSSMVESDFGSEPGLTTWSSGAKIYLIDSTTETTIDTQFNYIVTNSFQDDEIAFSTLKSVKTTNGYVHPNINMTRQYLPMSSGARMQITETHSYISYEMIDNGNTLISFRMDHSIPSVLINNQKKNQFGFYKPVKRLAPSISIYPNPTIDVLFVNLGGKIQETGGTLHVLSVDGKTVQNRIIAPNSSAIELYLTDLTAGIYFVKVENGSLVVNAKFIKQKY